MVNLRGPTLQEEIVIDVVKQMLREDRKDKVLAYIRKYRVNQVTDEDLNATLPKLLEAVDEDEGVTLTPWEAQVVWAYLSRLELTIKGERYR